MNQFKINCTLPPDTPPIFVGSPNARGTLDIVWGCLSILLICTWSVLHLNVPGQSTPRNKKERYARAAVRLYWSILWMLLNVLAPEWMLGKAWSDYRTVSSVEAEYAELSKKDGVPWTRSHSFFANMGGFSITFSKIQTEESSARPSSAGSTPGTDAPLPPAQDTVGTGGPANGAAPMVVQGVSSRGEHDEKDVMPDVILNTFSRLSRRRRKVVHAPLFSMGDIPWREDTTNSDRVFEAITALKFSHFDDHFERNRFGSIYGSWWVQMMIFRQDTWTLDANQLLLARQLGIIKRLPNLAEDDLDDRNKGDVFVKAVAMAQMAWFAVQLGFRVRFHMATSQLEIMTFAFAICAIIAYFLLREKPKDAKYSIEVAADRYATSRELARLAVAGPSYMYRRSTMWIPNAAIHADRTTPPRAFNRHFWFGATCSMLIFGVLHCIAWDFAFPSDSEKALWHTSSIITAATVPVIVFLQFSINRIAQTLSYCSRTKQGSVKIQKPITRSLLWLATTFCMLIFVSARIFILVEAVRSLAFLPPGAFSTTWTEVLPHLG